MKYIKIISDGYYEIDEEDLNRARFYHKEYSEEAMKTGSDMHSFAERFLNDRIRTSD